jgi:hypothetical protein
MNVRLPRIVVAFAVLMSTASGVFAEGNPDALTPLQTAVACAAPPFLAAPRPVKLRIIGVQDSVARTVFGGRDLLVVSGGSGAGVQLGQRFFVRRPVLFGMNSPSREHSVHTSGWITIVAVNETTSIASVDVTCSDISQDDYLEPFMVPIVPEDANRNDPSGEPNFGALGHVMFRSEEFRTGGPGDFMLIDRGSDHDTTLGARFAVYRDLRVGGLPLAAVGEGVVVSVGKTMSVMRITASRDAVESGDFVVPRKR